jgi:hypothetical protein
MSEYSISACLGKNSLKSLPTTKRHAQFVYKMSRSHPNPMEDISSVVRHFGTQGQYIALRYICQLQFTPE